MSTTSRLISGSAAAWAQIFVTIVSHIALVPLYLSYWNSTTYGVWLAIQALISVLTTLDLGYHDFLANEFLRCGENKKLALSKYLSSGICVSIVINCFQLLVIVLIVNLGAVPVVLGKSNVVDQSLIHMGGIVLLLQGVIWFACNSVIGLISRALAAFGYYPRMAWWSFFYTLFSNLASVVSVVFGANLLEAGIAATIACVIFVIPLYIDLFRLLRKQQIYLRRPYWKFGFQNFQYSLSVSAKGLMENFRQQGVRLVIAPLAGAVGLTAFSTMRTASNIALQGLNTVIYPLMPELMRFLHGRDQVRSEVAFGTVWFVIVAGMAPSLVVLQVFITPFFNVWTHGKVTFNPALFAALSLTILIYAVIQPALAVVKGNNLLKPQLWLSAIAAIIAVGGICLLLPILGIFGSGIALISAEIAAAIGYKIVAERWLVKNGLSWPKTPYRIAISSIYIAAFSMTALILFPHAIWITLAISLILFCANAYRYWKALPELANHTAKRILSSVFNKKTIQLDSL